MKSKLVAAMVTGLFVFGLVGIANAVPILQNGSLTGPIANGVNTPNSVPTGWIVINQTPDTMDENNNVGVVNETAFLATPSPSPDGGTWVGMGREGDGFIETFGQTVNGFDIGISYDLAWYHGNFGYDLGYDGANAIEVLLDGASIGNGSLLDLSTTWIDEMISFVATSTTHSIAFQLLNGTQAYHSIDGIRLSSTTVVPEPSTFLLLGGGLAGLFFTVRRKKKE